MYCYSSIGKSTHPVKCYNGYLDINGKKIRCPQWQKNGQSLPLSRILESGKIFPVKYISNHIQDLSRDFGYIGSYSYNCVDWPEVVEDDVHYVVFNKLNEYYNLEDVIACYVNRENPFDVLKPHEGIKKEEDREIDIDISYL